LDEVDRYWASLNLMEMACENDRNGVFAFGRRFDRFAGRLSNPGTDR
jgi:hypothetical protein